VTPRRRAPITAAGTGRYVALLRGINVGRGNRVAMADLRDILSGLGFTGVRTLLNSGNAVFGAPETPAEDLGARICAALSEALGLRLRVVVVDARGIDEALSQDPLSQGASEPSRSLIAFLADPRDRDRLAVLSERDWSPEAFAIGVRVAYLWCPNGVSDSPLALALGRELGDAVTVRNVATVAKIRALMAGG
jgi:uncharacterized protein (DUF1697 family)